MFQETPCSSKRYSIEFHLQYKHWTNRPILHTELFLSLVHPHENLNRSCRRRILMSCDCRRIQINQFIKTLNDPSNNTSRLGESKLLTQADPRPTVEGQKLPPPGSPSDPSLRSKFVHIFTPDILLGDALCVHCTQLPRRQGCRSGQGHPDPLLAVGLCFERRGGCFQARRDGGVELRITRFADRCMT